MLRRFLGPLVLAAYAVNGQTYGELAGMVTDPSGSALPNVRLRLTHIASGRAREVRTTEAGVYAAPFLAPGRYDISVEAAAFKTAVRRGIDIQVDVKSRIDFVMEVGALSETVEVIAAAPLINSENAAVGTIIENRRIVDLPLNGRNWLQMVSLSPNVSAEMRASGHVDSAKAANAGVSRSRSPGNGSSSTASRSMALRTRT